MGVGGKLADRRPSHEAFGRTPRQQDRRGRVAIYNDRPLQTASTNRDVADEMGGAARRASLRQRSHDGLVVRRLVIRIAKHPMSQGNADEPPVIASALTARKLIIPEPAAVRYHKKDRHRPVVGRSGSQSRPGAWSGQDKALVAVHIPSSNIARLRRPGRHIPVYLWVA
eukprot:9479656-Pyramimonas_sp.AAC.2